MRHKMKPYDCCAEPGVAEGTPMTRPICNDYPFDDKGSLERKVSVEGRREEEIESDPVFFATL